jgi:hypothetical protein
MTNLETNYLSYPEAIKEGVKPGYRTDWAVKTPTEEVEPVETPTEEENQPENPVTETTEELQPEEPGTDNTSQE